MRISQLEGRRVALWGWGREGRAAYAVLRRRFPQQPLTLFCTAGETADATALADDRLTVHGQATADALAAYEFVVKSPGISPYRAEAEAAAARGTCFLSGTRLWFAEHGGADAVLRRAACVTGTKGKSTTTALLAHLLRGAGHVTGLAGNIGLPLLEVLHPAPPPEFWAIELSSYQTGEVAASGVRPEVALVLNVFPEHLDWHGSEARYIEDKLRLVTEARPLHAVLDAGDERLAALRLPDSQVHWFGREDGWHLRANRLFRGAREIMDTSGLPLPGAHNRRNLCAALTAIEALGVDAAPLARHAAHFRPLPHRLQILGERDGLMWVNDSISTTPHASLAALACFSGRRVALLVGGHDRGLDWGGFAEAMRREAPTAVVTLGQNGPRIFSALRAVAQAVPFGLHAAVDLGEAVARAREVLGGDGVVLLSPGAPSFGAYRDYVERGRHFARLGGFDPDLISAIPGLGIA